MSRALIAYFSRADENYFSGALRTVETGNTETAAKLLQELTGADLFKIDPIQPYSKDYNECIAQAQDDQRRDARPELKAYPDSLDGYATIYLGYPNYWGTMPMPVFTFLERFDFTGKTIKPFCTHEGSGLGRSESDIRRLCPGARVERGLAILGSSAAQAGSALKNWL
ncbi:MAG: flavodoxin [Oscillospiraceae bacterium]